MTQGKKINYQLSLENTINSLASKKQKLLLHACCAPCASYVLEYLLAYFDITLYFYNPNIWPQAEHTRRLQELESFINIFAPCTKAKTKCIIQPYTPQDYEKAIDIKQNPDFATQKEGQARCYLCYKLRLEKTRQYAKNNGFVFWCTTLSISPYKNANFINQIASALDAKDKKTQFLHSDFKKKGGFLRSLQISQEYNLYRQNYCGCKYSTLFQKPYQKEYKISTDFKDDPYSFQR